MTNKWLTFDCYGTLVDWKTAFERILRPIATFKTSELVEAYNAAERTVENNYPHEGYRFILRESLQRAAKEIGIMFSSSQHDILAEQWHTMAIFADVRIALDRLKALGWQLGVLTNCDDELFYGTEGLFNTRFDFVVTSERVKAYKPELAHFSYFQAATGVEKRDWIHVGCSLYHDIVPANKIGIRSIWVDREGDKVCSASATARIQTAVQLPGAVKTVYELPSDCAR